VTTVDRAALKGGRTGWARSHRWLVGVWVVVALFAVVTAFRSHQVGVPLRDPDGAIFRWRILKSLVLFGILVLLDTGIRTRRSGWSLGNAVAELRTRWTRERLLLALSGLVAYHVVYICYRNIKSWVSFRDQHDDLLLRVDHGLFFGHSPAVLLHDLFGQNEAAYVFEMIYRSFTYVVPVSVVAALVFAPKIRDGYVLLMSSMWVWILGVGSYYLIPAFGPFASAPEEFAQLPYTSITSTQAEYVTERQQLLLHPGAADSFASISAFASLHIGFTCMVLLMLRYYGLRRAANVMVVYLVAVLLATVYLGWHYFIDDPAGIVLAALAVLLGRWMIQPRGRVAA
jgi:hypothetical protein